MSVKGLPPAPTNRSTCMNQMYVDMGPSATKEEKDMFIQFNFLKKIFLYARSDRADSSCRSLIGCENVPDRIKSKFFQNGIIFDFITIGSPPFRMYLQLAQMFPQYRFYTKCQGFSDCAYHGRDCYYFGECGNMRDCTNAIGHFGEGCYRKDRSVLPFTYPQQR